MKEPEENLLGDNMLNDGWFPSQLKEARKRAGAGEERVALELMVETDDGRLFSKTKHDIDRLKLEMMDSLKHRRIGSSSTIRMGSPCSDSNVFYQLRDQLVNLPHNQPYETEVVLNSQSKTMHETRKKRSKFDVHSFIEKEKAQQELELLQQKASICNAIKTKQMLQQTSLNDIRPASSSISKRNQNLGSRGPQNYAKFHENVRDENVPKSLLNSRSQNSSLVAPDPIPMSKNYIPYHQKVKTQKANLPNHRLRPQSSMASSQMHSRSQTAGHLFESVSQNPLVNSFKPVSESVEYQMTVSPQPTEVAQPVRDQPQPQLEDRWPQKPKALANPKQTGPLLYEAIPETNWWKKQFGVSAEEILDPNRPIPYFDLRMGRARKPIASNLPAGAGPNFFGIQITRLQTGPTDSGNFSVNAQKNASKQIRVRSELSVGSMQEYEGVAQSHKHSPGRTETHSSPKASLDTQSKVFPVFATKGSLASVKVQVSPMKGPGSQNTQKELLSPTGANRKSRVKFNIRSRSNSKLDEKSKQLSERSDSKTSSAQDPQVESVVRRSLANLKIKRASSVEESEQMAKESGNMSPIVRLDTRSFSALKENNLTEAEEEAIIKYIDKQTFSKNRVIRKVNEYLKTQRTISGTLATYKEKLIQFHYDQFSKQLHERLQLIDLEEIFQDDNTDLTIVEKREMVAAFLLGFSNNTRYKKFCKLFKNYISRVDEKGPANNKIGLLKGLVSVADLWDANFYQHVMRQGDYSKVKTQLSAQKLTATKQPL